VPVAAGLDETEREIAIVVALDKAAIDASQKRWTGDRRAVPRGGYAR